MVRHAGGCGFSARARRPHRRETQEIRPLDTAQPAVSVDHPFVLPTVEAAPPRLRIGRTTCYALIRSGELEPIDIGRLRRVPADAPAAYLARRRAARRAACRLSRRRAVLRDCP